MDIECPEFPQEFIITAVYGRKVPTYIVVTVEADSTVEIEITHKMPEGLLDAR